MTRHVEDESHLMNFSTILVIIVNFLLDTIKFLLNIVNFLLDIAKLLSSHGFFKILFFRGWNFEHSCYSYLILQYLRPAEHHFSHATGIW